MDEAKREAIEKAVVELGGEWPDEYEREPCLLRSRKCCLEGEGVYKASSFKKHEVSGNGLIFYEYICTREEFDQVKKKMKNNWRNTLEKRPEQREKTMKYQYGVEYECDGVKPDLDDDVEVQQCHNGNWLQFTRPAGEWPSWSEVSSFRIVDERYKPKSNWHERGELPPVGEIVEYKTTFFTLDDLNCGTCKVIAYNRDRVWIEYEDKPNSTAVINTAVIQFSPLTTEEDELLEQAHIDSENDEWLFSKRELVRRLIRKGWRPPKN